jgi:hypothetical protein
MVTDSVSILIVVKVINLYYQVVAASRGAIPDPGGR